MLSAFTTEASIILRRSSGRSALGFWEPVKAKGGDAIWMPPKPGLPSGKMRCPCTISTISLIDSFGIQNDFRV